MHTSCKPGMGYVQEDGHVLSVEAALLDPDERDRVTARCDAVVAAGAIDVLVPLCCGRDGPLEDRLDPAYVPPPAGKKGKAKRGKKKAAKPLPGVLLPLTHVYVSQVLPPALAQI